MKGIGYTVLEKLSSHLRVTIAGSIKLILYLDEENRDQHSWRPEPGSCGDEGTRVCSSLQQNPGETEPG